MGGEHAASGGGPSSSDAASLSERLAALGTLSLAELRTEWRRLYRSPPPRLSRELMVRAVAWRIQEKALGGLAPADQRRLQACGAKESGASGGSDPAAARPRPGTRLVREWNGRTYTVTVTAQGFAYDGQIYGSLTKVARVITGAHWSGPRFFGLNARAAIGNNTGSDGDRHG